MRARSASRTAEPRRSTSPAATGCRAISSAASRRRSPSDAAIAKRIEKQILPISLADNVKAWILDSDGKYHRRSPGVDGMDDKPLRSQEQFIALARAEAVHLGSYDEMIRRPGSFRRKVKKKKKH